MEARYTLTELLATDDWIRKLARTLVRDESLVDDIVQEGHLALLVANPDRIRDVKKWMKGTLRNILSQLRSREQRFVHAAMEWTEDDSLVDPGEILHREGVRRGLLDLVLELHEPYRTVILELYYKGLSSPEVARKLGRTETTIRTQHMRGRLLLREKAEARGIDDRTIWSQLPWLIGLRPGTPVAPVAGPAAVRPVLRSLLWILPSAVLVALAARSWNPDTRTNAAEPSVASTPAPVDELPGRVAPAPARVPFVRQPDLGAAIGPETVALVSAREHPSPFDERPGGAVDFDMYVLPEDSVRGPPLGSADTAWLEEHAIRSLRASTGDSGWAALNLDVLGDPDGPVQLVLRCASPEYLGYTAVQRVAPGEPRADIELHVFPRDRDVEIAVSGTRGTPLTDVDAVVYQRGRLNVPIAPPDPEGRMHFGFTSALDVAFVYVAAPGYAHGRVQVRNDESVYALVLEPDEPRQGQVLDEFGHPVEGARVSQFASPFATWTDSQGFYVLRGMPADAPTGVIDVVHPDYVARQFRLSEFSGPDVKLVLPAIAHLSGFVQGSRELDLSATTVQCGRFSARVDFRGNFTVEQDLGMSLIVKNPKAALHVVSPGELSGSTGILIELEARTPCEFSIIDDLTGQLLLYTPLADIVLGEARLHFDRAGDGYRIDELPRELGPDAFVKIDLPNRRWGSFTVAELRSGSVRVQPWAFLAGIVRAPAGVPVRGVTVRFAPASAPDSWSTLPGAKASWNTLDWAFAPTAGEVYRVVARADGLLPEMREVRASPVMSPITFDLLPAALIDIRVVAEGVEQPGARIEILAPDDLRDGRSHATDDRGLVTLEVAPGTQVELRASLAGFRDVVETIEIPATGPLPRTIVLER